MKNLTMGSKWVRGVWFITRDGLWIVKEEINTYDKLFEEIAKGIGRDDNLLTKIAFSCWMV